MPDRTSEPIETHKSVNGFIATDPKITFGDDGQARFYARYGVNKWQKEPDGSFTKLGTRYHDLVQFGDAAELSYGRFRKGDDFVAQGYVREYPHEYNGEQIVDEQFVAKRVMHDPNTTTYEVIRSPRSGGRETPALDRDPAAHTNHRQAEPEPLSAGRDGLGS